MNIVGVVARAAVVHSGLNDPVVSSALSQVEKGERGAAGAARVQEIAARLDVAAWDLQESQGDESDDYLSVFERARAASAVAFALEPDRESALESIYEAQAGIGSIDAVRRLIEPLLHGD